MSWRRSVALLVLAGLSVAGSVMGVNAIETNVEFVRARNVVETAREQLASGGDDHSVLKQVARAVEPSVVNISVRKTIKLSKSDLPMSESLLRKYFEDKDNDDQAGDAVGTKSDDGSVTLEQKGTGSGIIMDVGGGRGVILSNHHVVGDADRVDVTLADGRVFPNAKVLGTDPKTDLAVVEIRAEGLIPAQWGDSSKLEVGDSVMAFGSPFGYVGSMTHGIISALHRKAGILGEYGYEDFIQTDAAINPGNSGGPLVDMRGRVIGVNTAIASESGGFQGIGFAVPANTAKHVYRVLKENGKVTRGFLGIQSEDVSKALDEAKATGYEGRTGALVKGVLRNAPATGKLRPGDVIIAMDGKSIANVQQLRETIAMMAPGTETTVRIVRNGKEQDVKLKIAEQPGGETPAKSGAPERRVEQQGSVGVRLVEVPAEVAKEYELNGKSVGAMVAGVRPGSAAAEAGIRKGDVITRIGEHDVKNAKEAEVALAKADLKKGVRVSITNRTGAVGAFLRVPGEG